MDPDELSDDQREKIALYQHGDKVAENARHAVHGPGSVSESRDFDSRDVVAAMFYMHQQTIGQLATALQEEVFDDLDEPEIEEQVGTVLSKIQKRERE
jgi:hypothetical protein